LLVELGYCTQKDVAAALAGQAGMAYIDISNIELSEQVKNTIPAENVHAYQIVPIEYNSTSKRLKIAMKSADNFRAVDDLRLLMGFNVEAVVADPAAIDNLIKKHYAKQDSVVDVGQLAGPWTRSSSSSRGAGDSIDLDAVMEAAVRTTR
jgi:type IV pilus assembly protein PilB